MALKRMDACVWKLCCQRFLEERVGSNREVWRSKRLCFLTSVMTLLCARALRSGESGRSDLFMY